jgi:hypothetical protein
MSARGILCRAALAVALGVSVQAQGESEPAVSAGDDAAASGETPRWERKQPGGRARIEELSSKTEAKLKEPELKAAEIRAAVKEAVPPLAEELAGEAAERESAARKQRSDAEETLARLRGAAEGARLPLVHEMHAAADEDAAKLETRRAEAAKQRLAAVAAALKARQARRDAERAAQDAEKPHTPSRYPTIEIVPPGKQPERRSPAIHFHDDYYNGPQEFRSGRVEGGPTMVVARHPITQQEVEVELRLPPGYPKVHYSKHSITYEYPDLSAQVVFTRCGDYKVEYCQANRVVASAKRAASHVGDHTRKVAQATGAGSAAKQVVGLAGSLGSLAVGPVGNVSNRLPGISALGAPQLGGLTDRLAGASNGGDTTPGVLTRKPLSKLHRPSQPAPGTLTQE